MKTPLSSRPLASVPTPERAGKALLIVVAVLLGGLVLFAGCGVSTYNGIVTQEQEIDAAFSEITNQYQRRYELIPNLVAVVQGVADFEKETITAVTEARASVGQIKLDELPSDPGQLQAYMGAQQGLGSALSRLLVVAENYPDLKATASFRDLQVQIEGTDNRIAVARRDYIDAVKLYNQRIAVFPANLVAGMFGKEKWPQLEAPADTDVTRVPEVSFGGDE